MSEYGPNDYKFSRPAEHIKALNVGPVPERIFDGIMTPLVVCPSSTIPFPAPAENRTHFVNYVTQDSQSTGSSFLARVPKAASSLLTDQRTLRFPSSIGFLRIQAPPIWNDCHFLILVREEPFGPSVRFRERTGAVLGGLVVPSWSWTSPETRIFSSGMRRELQIP